jgi:hypothetical protein
MRLIVQPYDEDDMMKMMLIIFSPFPSNEAPVE